MCLCLFAEYTSPHVAHPCVTLPGGSMQVQPERTVGPHGETLAALRRLRCIVSWCFMGRPMPWSGIPVASCHGHSYICRQRSHCNSLLVVVLCALLIVFLIRWSVYCCRLVLSLIICRSHCSKIPFRRLCQTLPTIRPIQGPLGTFALHIGGCATEKRSTKIDKMHRNRPQSTAKRYFRAQRSQTRPQCPAAAVPTYNRGHLRPSTGPGMRGRDGGHQWTECSRPRETLSRLSGPSPRVALIGCREGHRHPLRRRCT